MSGEGARGDRGVSPEMVERADVYSARDMLPKEGGSWGKHGFPHGSEPEASDAHAAAEDTAARTAIVSVAVRLHGNSRARRRPRSPS